MVTDSRSGGHHLIASSSRGEIHENTDGINEAIESVRDAMAAHPDLAEPLAETLTRLRNVARLGTEPRAPDSAPADPGRLKAVIDTLRAIAAVDPDLEYEITLACGDLADVVQQLEHRAHPASRPGPAPD